MLYLYTGTPGSGKSLHVAKDILEHLSWGRPVIANFPISSEVKGYDRFTYKDNLSMTPDFLVAFAREFWGDRKVKEDRILLCLDEAQLLFNSRNWSQTDRMKWITFLSQHRHFGYKILFITQFDRMIDRQIRSLAEYEVKHRKMSSFGIRGKVASLLAFGQVFCAVTVYYGMREKIGARFFRGKRSLYRLYDSYALFEGCADGAEGRGDGVPAPMADGAPSQNRDAVSRRGFAAVCASRLSSLSSRLRSFLATFAKRVRVAFE